jgi:2-polyprenyl-3-methyl-5-hydroxy-6-metoxy-1,4-benzoquinol methylase
VAEYCPPSDVTKELDLIGVFPVDFRTAARKHGRHFARYIYAARYAAGKRVLDAGCGGGYGSAYLAGFARTVLGVDLGPNRIEHARASFSRDNLEYRQADLQDPGALGGPFDLITCFEVLEHVGDSSKAIRNLSAALADDGVALLSVPNGEMEILAGEKKSFHDTHFTADALRKALEERFGSVQFFSQVYVKNAMHYLRKLIDRGRHHADNYRFVPGLDHQAKIWMAECRVPKRG